MNTVSLRHIGKSADDLRFFISSDGCHAGGITVHSIARPSFSYGIAIAAPMRRRGIAGAALPQLFDVMHSRGFTHAFVDIAPENTASLALHHALGFTETSRSAHAVRMERFLP